MEVEGSFDHLTSSLSSHLSFAIQRALTTRTAKAKQLDKPIANSLWDMQTIAWRVEQDLVVSSLASCGCQGKPSAANGQPALCTGNDEGNERSSTLMNDTVPHAALTVLHPCSSSAFATQHPDMQAASTQIGLFHPAMSACGLQRK